MPSTIRPASELAIRARSLPEEISLINWPLRDQPIGSSLAMALAAGAGWLTVWATDNPLAGALIFCSLGITLWRTWLPVRFQLGSGGVVQTALGRERRIAWLEIARYELQEDGVIFFRDVESTSLAALRGLYVRWGDQREKVQALIEFYLPQ